MQKILWLEPFWIALLAPTLLFPGYFWNPALQPLFILLLFVGPLLRIFFSSRIFTNFHEEESRKFESIRAIRDQSLPEWLLVVTVFMGVWVATDRSIAWEVAGYTLLGINAYWSLIHWPPAQRRPEWVALLLCTIGVALALAGPMIVAGRPDPTLALIEERQTNMEFLGETVNHNVLAGGIILVAPLLLAMGLGGNFRGIFWTRMGSNADEEIRTTSLSASKKTPHPCSPVSVSKKNGTRMNTGKREFQLSPFILYPLSLLVIPVVAALPLTNSRGGYLAVALSLAAVLMIRWPKLAYTLPVVGVGLGIALLSGWEFKPFLDSLIGDDSLSGMDGRLEIWNRALYLIHDFPLTGAGLGMFGQVIPALYPYFLFDAHIPHAHNLLLQIATDVGLFGLLCYMWIGGRVARLQSGRVAEWQSGRVASASYGDKRPLREQLSTIHYQLSIGVLGALVALVVHGIFDAVLWGTKLAFMPWLLFALGTLLAVDREKG